MEHATSPTYFKCKMRGGKFAHPWEVTAMQDPAVKSRRGVAAGHTRRMMAKGNVEGVGDVADTGATDEGSRLGTGAG